MLILSSPSGAGKTTLVKLLSESRDFHISISHTTRKPRINENQDKDYHFVDNNEFENLIKKDEFLEYAKVFNHLYGTTKTPVINNLKNGKNVIFDIDWQGTKQLSENKNLSLVTFFILPPNRKVLKERLLNRHEKQEEIVEKRMNKFNEEVSHWNEYNYVVVNDDLNECYNTILSIIMSEKKGLSQKQNLSDIHKKINELIG